MVFGWAVMVLGVVALALALLVAPPEATMGDRQRIMYFHVASAWNAYLAFFVVFISSLLFLRRGERRWDRLAFCSAELGVFFTTLALVSGSIWGRSVWGVWWTWDPRLTTTLILWFLYIGYLLLRSGEEDPRRARLAAVLGIIGFVDVPIIHMSVVWWQSLHPVVIRPGKVDMEGSMVLALVAAVFAFTAFYFYLLRFRFRLEEGRERMLLLREKIGGGER